MSWPHQGRAQLPGDRVVDAKGRALQLTLAPGRRNDMIAAEEIVFPKR